MGQSVSWAHNLFVLWTLCFLLRVILCPETQSLTLVPAGLSPPFSQSHPLFSEVVTLLSFCLLLSVSNHPLLLILVSYSQREVSGSVMIIPDYKWKWGSNYIVFKWVFFWEWQQQHWNQFPPSKGCPAAILPKVILNSRDMVSLSNHIPVRDAINWIKPGLRLEVFGPRLQVRYALGQESQHKAWAPSLASLGPRAVQGVRAKVRTIGSRLKAQRARGSRTVHQTPIDLCPATENESRMPRARGFSGSLTVNHGMDGMFVNAPLKSALCQIVIFVSNYGRWFANRLTVHELSPCVLGLPKGTRRVFPPPPSLNASIPINSFS